MEFKTQKHKRKLYLKRVLKLSMNCFSDKQCYSVGFVSYSYNYTNLNSKFEFCFTGNILLKEEKSDDLCERLTIIDWEYCSYNYRLGR